MRWSVASRLMWPGAVLVGVGASVLSIATLVAVMGGSWRAPDVARAAALWAGAPLVAGALLLIVSLAGAHGLERRSALASLRRAIVISGVMVLPTVLLFGPIGGFHHQLAFGLPPFCYMLWDGERPTAAGLQIVDGYDVLFSAPRFIAWLSVWAIVLLVVQRVVRSKSSRNEARP